MRARTQANQTAKTIFIVWQCAREQAISLQERKNNMIHMGDEFSRLESWEPKTKFPTKLEPEDKRDDVEHIQVSPTYSTIPPLDRYASRPSR